LDDLPAVEKEELIRVSSEVKEAFFHRRMPDRFHSSILY